MNSIPLSGRGELGSGVLGLRDLGDDLTVDHESHVTDFLKLVIDSGVLRDSMVMSGPISKS